MAYYDAGGLSPFTLAASPRGKSPRPELFPAGGHPIGEVAWVPGRPAQGPPQEG